MEREKKACINWSISMILTFLSEVLEQVGGMDIAICMTLALFWYLHIVSLIFFPRTAHWEHFLSWLIGCLPVYKMSLSLLFLWLKHSLLEITWDATCACVFHWMLITVARVCCQLLNCHYPEDAVFISLSCTHIILIRI